MRTGKITRHLTLLLSLCLTALLVLVVGVQLLIVSRSYTTSEYTKNRESALEALAANWEEIYQKWIFEADREVLTRAMNRYAGQNSACCLLLEEDGSVFTQSDNAAQMPESYLSSIRSQVNNSSTYRGSPAAFRIRGKLGLYTRYVAVVRKIYGFDAWNGQFLESGRTVYFVAVTKEVFTLSNYRLWFRWGCVLLLLLAAVSFAFSFGISRFITKPILQLHQAARKMAQLDFSQKCAYHASNELGDLSDSLNFLSDKLSCTIEQLEQANQVLQRDLDIQKETDRMRRSFIAAASHEFKTPLTLLRGYLEMLQEGRLGASQVQQAEKVMMQEIDRLDAMVLELLDLSRYESENWTPNIVAFDLCGLAEKLLETNQPLLSARKLSCRFQPESPIMTVLGDSDGIEKVLSNYLSNAIKYAPEGSELTLTIVWESLENGSKNVILSLFNPGNPIAPDDLAHLWEPFYRVDKSRARQTGGNGLGLAICKDILDRHGSRCGVRNDPGGVTFFFTLQTASIS